MPQQMHRVLGYIDAGRQDGAAAGAWGAGRSRTDSGGYYVEPTVLDEVRADMRIAREEIFGPVLATHHLPRRGGSHRDRQRHAYGLAAAVWTQDLNSARRMARAIRAGMVCVNCCDAGDITVPFGGFPAVRHRARQVAACLRQVHRAEDHVDRAEVKERMPLWLPPGPLRFVATCHAGSADLLATEIAALGWRGCARKPVVACASKARLPVGYRACSESRLASRVLLEVGARRSARTEDLLRTGARCRLARASGSEGHAGLRVHRQAPDDQQHAFRRAEAQGCDLRSAARHHARCGQPSRRSGRICACTRMQRREVALLIDLAGDRLGRRGYRLAGGEAPLRENIAAGILHACGLAANRAGWWEFLDPMCGSGTFVIEAAWMATHTAPGLLRDFWGFQGWRGYDCHALGRAGRCGEGAHAGAASRGHGG